MSVRQDRESERERERESKNGNQHLFLVTMKVEIYFDAGHYFSFRFVFEASKPSVNGISPATVNFLGPFNGLEVAFTSQ